MNGQHWHAKIDTNGIVEVNYNKNMLDFKNKGITKQTDLSAEQLQELCKSFINLQYLALPDHIGTYPAPLHAPWFALDFIINGKKHRTELYYPEGKDLPETIRFEELWKTLFKNDANSTSSTRGVYARL